MKVITKNRNPQHSKSNSRKSKSYKHLYIAWKEALAWCKSFILLIYFNIIIIYKEKFSNNSSKQKRNLNALIGLYMNS